MCIMDHFAWITLFTRDSWNMKFILHKCRDLLAWRSRCVGSDLMNVQSTIQKVMNAPERCFYFVRRTRCVLIQGVAKRREIFHNNYMNWSFSVKKYKFLTRASSKMKVIFHSSTALLLVFTSFLKSVQTFPMENVAFSDDEGPSILSVSLERTKQERQASLQSSPSKETYAI